MGIKLKFTSRKLSLVVLAATLSLSCLACARQSDAEGKAQPAAVSNTEKGVESKAPVQGENVDKAAALGKVGRVVFMDKENCCDCTNTRQKSSWNNLQAAVDAAPAKPLVEVIHLDSQADEAAVYLDLEAVMVPPGLYFFDHKENLLKMLQGEVSQDQIEAIFN